LFSVLQSNPKAKFVTRVVQFGSEPLFDWAISARGLAQEVRDAKSRLANLKIRVTVSEMAYGYQAVSSSSSDLKMEKTVANTHDP
jgi:exo-beta-1,3-glucanase (GH17 family)